MVGRVILMHTDMLATKLFTSESHVIIIVVYIDI